MVAAVLANLEAAAIWAVANCWSCWSSSAKFSRHKEICLLIADVHANGRSGMPRSRM